MYLTKVLHPEYIMHLQNLVTRKQNSKNNNKIKTKLSENAYHQWSCKHMENKNMKIISLWLINREMQIKTTLQYHLTPLRMTIIKISINCIRSICGEKGTFTHSRWDCKMVHGKQNGRKLIQQFPYFQLEIWSSNSTPEYISSKNKNTNANRYMHPSVQQYLRYGNNLSDLQQMTELRQCVCICSEILFSYKKMNYGRLQQYWLT